MSFLGWPSSGSGESLRFPVSNSSRVVTSTIYGQQIRPPRSINGTWLLLRWHREQGTLRAMDGPADTPVWLTRTQLEFPDSDVLQWNPDNGTIEIGGDRIQVDEPISVHAERYEEGAWWRRLLGLERPCLRVNLRQNGEQTTFSAPASSSYVEGLPWRLHPDGSPDADISLQVEQISGLISWLNTHGQLTVARWPRSSTIHPRDRTDKHDDEKPVFWRVRAVYSFIWLIIAVGIVITPLVGFTLLVCDDFGVDELMMGGVASGALGGLIVRWQARQREWWPTRLLERKVTLLKPELAGWASPVVGAGVGTFYAAVWSDYFRPNLEYSYVSLLGLVFFIFALIGLLLHMARQGVFD